MEADHIRMDVVADEPGLQPVTKSTLASGDVKPPAIPTADEQPSNSGIALHQTILESEGSKSIPELPAEAQVELAKPGSPKLDHRNNAPVVEQDPTVIPQPKVLADSPVPTMLEVEPLSAPYPEPASNQLPEPKQLHPPTLPDLAPVHGPSPPPSISLSSQNVRLPPISYVEAQAAASQVDAQTTSPPQPQQPSTLPVAPATERPLNVTDALSYLDAVKVQFQDQPDVYNHFLDIMKDFKSQLIDTPGVIKRVSYLFNGHPQLIQGFNTFLPIGYRIDAQGKNFITVTTPTGTTTQTTMDGGGETSGQGALNWSISKEGPMLNDTGVLALGPDSIGVADPMVGITNSNINEGILASTPLPAGRASGSPDPSMYDSLDTPAIEPAVQYVQKIKQRCDPETYKQFLEILSCYHQKPDTIDEREVHVQISRLFKDAPDLRSDFKIFMPEKSHSMFEEPEDIAYDASGPSERRSGRLGTPIVDKAVSSKRSKEPVPVTVPQKRKRRVEKEKEKDVVSMSTKSGPVNKTKQTKQQLMGNDVSSPSFSQSKYHASESSPRRSHHQPHTNHHTHSSHHAVHAPPGALPPNDQAGFFDRVKLALENRETYNEFLKVVNLFTQDIIDTAFLVKQSRSFLGDGELMRQWRDILGWDDKRERECRLRETQDAELSSWARGLGSAVAGVVLEKPGRKDLNVRYGSYRKLPPSEANVTCSGRDDMCKSVLNDEWVSHPTWSSEDSGFLAHKMNVYEEALHRSEEERHEYDFHIEAIVRTISMLEPINNKIAQLPPDERGSFKLKANLGGSGKSIHQRVIKKIYGREAGMDVIQAMQDSPSLAIPVVLTRLKQKEEEWKRAQREWNKVWREVDARNFLKSLDHQGISFKATDKKAISTKTFVSQIEAARDEQMAKRASLIDPLFARTRPRHHLEFVVDDMAAFQDGLKLTFSFLDRTTHQIAAAERKKIESLLRGFVPTFFMVDPDVFNQAFTVVIPPLDNPDSDVSDDISSVADDAETSSVASGSSRTSRSHRKGGVTSGGGDLRKKLLKSEQAKSTSRKTRAQEAASPSGSRQATPVAPDMMLVENSTSINVGDIPGQNRRTPRKNIFFSNTTCYVLLRLLELLYSRLLLFKTMSTALMSNPGPRFSKKLPPAIQEQIVDLRNHQRSSNAEHYYHFMLESIERLFENDIEQHLFEDQMRSMFGIKEAYKLFTIDKLIGSIIKQVQVVLQDPKSQELLELLKKERTHGTLTTQDQINSRQNAERILGPDENLFRIDWLPECKTVTVQLLGKDDSSFDDSEVSTGRWQAYIDSYVSSETTENLPPHRMKRPFLRKNLSTVEPKVVARSGLEIKVCVRTYRFFYVSNTEDVLWRLSEREEIQANQKLQAKTLARKIWMENLDVGSFQRTSS